MRVASDRPRQRVIERDVVVVKRPCEIGRALYESEKVEVWIVAQGELGLSFVTHLSGLSRKRTICFAHGASVLTRLEGFLGEFGIRF